MAVDISQETQAIRTAVFAKDVRNSIANGLDTMATDINQYEGQLSSDNDQFKTDITAEEAQHAQAESARVTAETARVSAENTRQANEQTRQTNETARETAFAGMQHVDANLELSAARQGYDSLLLNLQNKDSQLADIIQPLETTLSQHTSIFSAGTGNDVNNNGQTYNTVVEGQSNVKLEGMTAQNLVTNGDFSNGVAGWTSYRGTAVASAGTYTHTGDGSNAIPYNEQNLPLSGAKKIYVRSMLRATSASCLNLAVQIWNGSTISDFKQSNPTQNKWYKLSGIVSTTFSGLNTPIGCRHEYTDASTANGKSIEIRYIMAIDLTALGLDTLTIDQCDAIFDHYIDGLTGVASVKLTSLGANLFNIADFSSKLLSTNPVNNGELGDITTNSITFSSIADDCFTSSYNHLGCYKIKVKPLASYNLSFNKLKNTNGTSYVFFYSQVGSFLIDQTTTTTTFVAFTTPSNCDYITIRFGIANAGHTETFSNIQLAEGTTATTYEPYKSSTLTTILPQSMSLNRLPNGISDTVEEINGIKTFAKRTMEYTLQASDVVSYSAGTNKAQVAISKNVFANSNIWGTSPAGDTLNDKTGIEIYPNVWDSTDNLITFGHLDTAFYFFFPKTKYADLAAAQTALAGTKVVYQLATPVYYKHGESGFTQDGNIETYSSGTIYQEPINSVSKATNNAKLYTTYNLSEKSQILSNSAEITAINKKMDGWGANSYWISPTLINGWINFGGNEETAGYYKDEFGIVHLKGFIKSGTINSTIFILPTGYKPIKNRYFAVVSNNAFGTVQVNFSGNVTCTVGNNLSVSLDGITFKAEQ